MRIVFAAIGLVEAALAGAAPAQTLPDRPRIIVDGYGEAKTMPDVVTISYTLRGEGPTSDEAVHAMVAMGNRVEMGLRGIDRAAEPKTGDVRVGPVKGSACKDRDYDSDEHLSKGTCAVVGYVATQNVTVRSFDVKDAGTMVGVISRGGAYSGRINSFDLNDARAAKRQAIAAALADAQAKAAAVAAGSHVALGAFLTASTVDREVVRTEDLVNSLPQSFAAERDAPPPVTVKLTPEQITTSANVTVSYAIQ